MPRTTFVITALILGKGVRVALELFREAGAGAVLSIVTQPVTLLVAVFALGFLALLLSVGWEQFRYPGELVFTGDHVEVVKLNKLPGETRIARFVINLLDRISDATQPKEPPR